MTLPLNEDSFEQFISIPTTKSATEALEELRNAERNFAVIGNANYPQTLLGEKELTSLSSKESRPLAEVLEQLPPALVVDTEVGVLDPEKLKQLGKLLQKEKAPGLMVYKNNQVIGIIPRTAIAKALPLDAITFTDTRSDLYGQPVVPFRLFVCNKCNPLRYQIPREGTPSCPLHGPMESK